MHQLPRTVPSQRSASQIWSETNADMLRVFSSYTAPLPVGGLVFNFPLCPDVSLLSRQSISTGVCLSCRESHSLAHLSYALKCPYLHVHVSYALTCWLCIHTWMFLRHWHDTYSLSLSLSHTHTHTHTHADTDTHTDTLLYMTHTHWLLKHTHTHKHTPKVDSNWHC
jgi:hypothetical protein